MAFLAPSEGWDGHALATGAKAEEFLFTALRLNWHAAFHLEWLLRLSPLCTSPSIIIYDPHTSGLPIKGKDRGCTSWIAQPAVWKGLWGRIALLPDCRRNSVFKSIQRVLVQLVSNCFAFPIFFLKGWTVIHTCDKFGVVVFNLYILSGNIYIQMQGLAFVSEMPGLSIWDVNSLFWEGVEWFRACRSWTHESFFY